MAQRPGVEPIGIVSQLSGAWTRTKDQKALVPGDEIFPDSTVHSDPSTSNTIRVALFDGSIWARLCTTQDPCDGGSYRVAFKNPPDRSFLGFLATYFSARQRVPIIFTASRGIMSRGSREAVLVLNGPAVDLAPALNSVPAGRWRVTLTDPSRAGDRGVVQEIDWPRESGLRADTLSAAVYALDVQSTTGQPFGSPSAVLLTTPEQAKAARDQFDKARDLAAHWTGMDATTVRSFLVQVLYAIQLRMQP